MPFMRSEMRIGTDHAPCCEVKYITIHSVQVQSVQVLSKFSAQNTPF
jgi:hypothetical protein